MQQENDAAESNLKRPLPSGHGLYSRGDLVGNISSGFLS